MKKWVIIISLVIAVWLLAVGYQRLAESIGGRTYDVSNLEDLADLRSIIKGAESFKMAIEDRRQGTGNYSSVSEDYQLQIVLPSRKEKAVYPLFYFPDDDAKSFSLYIKLGWDPGLYYSSNEKTWVYNPGDGREETILTP